MFAAGAVPCLTAPPQAPQIIRRTDHRPRPGPNGAGGAIEQRFRNLLLCVASSGLKDEIRFPQNAAPFAAFNDPAAILEPVLSRNNVARRITEAERLEIVAAASQAWETTNFAPTDNDDDVLWETFQPLLKVKA
jgi:hypothetical protein